MSVYASSDWHGCAEPAIKLLNYLKPDDTLYFLGDAIDRGDQGVELLEILLKDPRVKMINGNHEMMMINALKEYLKELYEEDALDTLYDDIWFYNGGSHTWENGLRQKNRVEIKYLINTLFRFPNHFKYTSPAGHTVILEHAGYTPTDRPFRSHDPYWDREHFLDDWGGPDNTYLVHGHTPVQYLKFSYRYKDALPLTKEEKKQKDEWLYSNKIEFDWKPTTLRYCDNHKFDIDMCTIISGRVALLNLDTFETIYFDKE